jgi:hypothetical protein
MVKSVNFKHTVRTTILETCIGTPKKLRRVMNLEYSNGETVNVPRDSHNI